MGQEHNRNAESANYSVNMIQDLQRKIDDLRNFSRKSSQEKLERRESGIPLDRSNLPQNLPQASAVNRMLAKSQTQGPRHFKLKIDDSVEELSLMNTNQPKPLNVPRKSIEKNRMRNLSNTSSQKDMKTVQRPNAETEAYKQENRLLKNRLKSLLAIKEVHELNRVYTSNGRANSSDENLTPLESQLDFEQPKKVKTGL